MRHVAKAVLLAAVVLFPSLVHAQTLAGTVRDPSGAVLPGVTVEAASPALIEKVRTTVTDGNGLYQIPDLRPGMYTMTFTLPGFTTVRREEVQVSGAQVITINTEMRVGGLQETITVTGETPIVDVQSSTRRSAVLDDSVIEALPASRGYGNLLASVPGIQATNLDSGTNPTMNFFTARGGRGNEGTVQIDGMNVGSAFNGGGVASFAYPTMDSTEIQVTIAGGLGETDRGGPAFNMIPKTGGNDISGSVFFSTAGKWSQGDNLDDELRSFGFREAPALIKNWDSSFSLGGPIMRDRLWYYGTLRSFGSHNEILNVYANRNAGDPTKWNYEADQNVRARAANDKKVAAIRLTGQANERNKLTFYYDYQKNCTGSAFAAGGDQCRDRGDDWIALGGTGTSPEAGNVWDDREKIVQAAWSSPLTSRLLLEAGYSTFISRWGGQVPAGALTSLIPVTEQSTAAGVPVPNFTYRGWASAPSNDQAHNVWRAAMSYVTGAHNAKFGYQAAYQVLDWITNAGSQLSYTLNNGNPVQLTMRAAPHIYANRTRYDAFYAQDTWTINRLTLQGALRYEHAWSWYPEGKNGIIAANDFSPQFLFPEKKGVTGYHDVTPRMGAAYDVFGNGRTSLKGYVGKYLQAANNDAQYTIANPGVTFQQTTNRQWSDANRNFTPDCELMNPAANGECGPWANSNFGSFVNTTAVNPDVLEGWGRRPYDWQTGIELQQQILPRVSASVAYSRRAWGNFYALDNLALGPEDFDTVTIAAPSHASLPDGGGYPVTFVTRNARSPLGATNNYYTFASDYGDVTAYWHGVDLTANARLANGLTFQGGTSTGRGVRDYCDLTAELPELYVTGAGTPGSLGLGNGQVDSCSVAEDWLTNFRGLISYTVPRVDVLVSGIIRSQANAQPATTNTFVATNGASLAANYNVTSAILQAQTGRTLAPGQAFQTVDLTLPGHLYGERVNVVDMRFGKILRFGGTRTNVALDLYNLFNANTGTGFNQTFDPNTAGATWLRPTALLSPRFMRFNVTFDF